MARCSRYSCGLARRGAYMGRAGRQVASNGLMTREAGVDYHEEIKRAAPRHPNNPTSRTP